MTEDGFWFSHFSQACSACSRPTVPQLTKAPATFAGTELGRGPAPSAAPAIASAASSTAPSKTDFRSVHDITCSRRLAGQLHQKPLCDLDRTLCGEMTEVELHRHVTLGKFIAMIVAADRIIGRKIGRAVRRRDLRDLAVALAHAASSHEGG